MTIIDRMRSAVEFRGVDANISYSDVFGKGLDLFLGTGTSAGVAVTTNTALEVSTVYACLRILSEGVSTLPLDTMVRRNGVPRPIRPRPEWISFKQGPYNKIESIGQIMTSLLTDGNAYLATVRDVDGLILWVEVLDPSKVEPKRLKDGTFIYEIQQVNGSTAAVSDQDIKHIRGMMLPGAIKGLSPISYASETIGLAAAATEFGGAFFGNGAVPGSTIEVPGELSEVAAKVLKDTWEQAHRGVGNGHRLAVLTEGAKFAKVTLSPDEAQFLQTRSFQVPDIARFYGVPLHLLAQEGPTFGDSNSENGVAFVQHTLRPWIERIEAAFTDLLETEFRQDGIFVKLNVDSLLRGNLTERLGAWSIGVTQGIYTINEVRRWEALPPVAWGDEPISVQVQGEPSASDDSSTDEDTGPKEGN